MKLSAVLVKQTLSQLEEQAKFQDAYAVPEDNPTASRLSELFGDHTFFLDNDGLHIVEQVESDRAAAPVGKVVKLARWKDKDHTSLAPQKPEATDVLILLGSDGPDEAS
jgi:hypothetical protein